MSDLTLGELIKNTANNEQQIRDFTGEIVEGKTGFYTGELSSLIGRRGNINKYNNQSVIIGMTFTHTDKKDYTHLIDFVSGKSLGWTDNIEDGFHE